MNNIFWNIWNFENERNDNMAKLIEKELPKYYVKETGDYYCLYEKEGNKYLGRLSPSGKQDLALKKGAIEKDTVYAVGQENGPGKVTETFGTLQVEDGPDADGKFALGFFRIFRSIPTGQTAAPDEGRLAAFFGEKAQWFLENTTAQGTKLGSIYRNDQPLRGAWPVPVVFSDEIKAQLNDNKEVEGDIDFYIQNGTYAGTLSFDKSGKCTGVKKDNFENDTVAKFKRAFFEQSRNSKVAEWKNSTNIHEICIAVKKDRFFKRKLAKYLEPHSSDVNDEGKEILKRELHIDKVPLVYEAHAGCLLYIYFVNTGKISIASDLSNDVETSNVAEKVLEFTKQAKGWKTKDGDYFLSAHSGNEASRADVVVLCKMINDKLVKLYNKNGKPTSGIGTIFDGKKDLGKVTFNNSGEITESSIKEPTDSNGLGRFYDSVKEYDGESEFYKSIKEYDGDLSYLALEIDVRNVIEKAGLNINSSEYGDFARAIENHKRLKSEIDALYRKAIEMKVAEDGGMVYSAQELLNSISLDEEYKSKINDKIGKLKTEEEKVDAISRLLLRIENKENKEARERYKNRSILSRPFHKKERDAGIVNRNIRSSFKNAAKYIMKCVSKPDALKCSDLLNNFRLLNKDKQLNAWYNSFRTYMSDDTVKKCVRNIGKSDDAKIKVVLGILFARMIGLGGPNNIICACNALKDGGIKSEDEGVIANATKIRKAIKAKCGSAVGYDDLKTQVTKLCGTDYKFMTLNDFGAALEGQQIPWDPKN